MKIEEALEELQKLKDEEVSLQTFLDSTDHSEHKNLSKLYLEVKERLQVNKECFLALKAEENESVKLYKNFVRGLLAHLLTIQRSEYSPNKTMLLTMELIEYLDEYDMCEGFQNG
jgi:hypothetical protein